MSDKNLARTARVMDRTMNTFIVLFLILALLVSGYALYDQYKVVHASDSFGLTDDADIYKKMMELMAQNPDVKGWVYLEDTGINYPILQGKDDWAYISKDYQGKDSGGGSIFIKEGNSPDFTDFQTILMGHNMNGGRVFGDVPKFRDKAFYNTHQRGKIFLPDRILRLEPAVFLEAASEDHAIYGVPQTGEAAKETVIQEVYAKAINTSGPQLTTTDQIVTLSTCSLNSYEGRYLLVNRVIGTLPVPSN